MSTTPFTSGTFCCSIASMPWRSVTSAMPHPWHPPAMRTITTASCTSISSIRPPCRATIGFTWLSNRSHRAPLLRLDNHELAAAGVVRLGGDPDPGGVHPMNIPPAVRPRLIAGGTTDPRREPGARRGPHLARRVHQVAQRRQRLLPTARLETAVGVDPDLAVVEHLLHALQRLHDLRRGWHPGRIDVVEARPDPVRGAALLG